jgi:hypothetical protein
MVKAEPTFETKLKGELYRLAKEVVAEEVVKTRKGKVKKAETERADRLATKLGDAFFDFFQRIAQKERQAVEIEKKRISGQAMQAAIFQVNSAWLHHLQRLAEIAKKKAYLFGQKGNGNEKVRLEAVAIELESIAISPKSRFFPALKISDERLADYLGLSEGELDRLASGIGR